VSDLGPGAPRTLVLAHRGARTVAPENTLEAFRVALAEGADGVELDVHRTSDGRLVVHHDADATGIGVLAEHALDAIRDARPDIPTLAEVLDLCAGVLVNVEIKNLPGDADYDHSERAAELVVATLADRGARDDVLVSSFNLMTIDRVRALDPSIPTAFLVMFGIDADDAIGLCVERGHGALHPSIGMLADGGESLVTHAHERGVSVNVWTVNDEDDMARLGHEGVDGLITDLPAVARRVIDSERA
jgi:glycerophosphoryl diester phosphodiesterase